MRRFFTLVLVGAFALGGLAACGDDDDGGGSSSSDDSSEEGGDDSGDDSGGGGGGGGDAVAENCQAVDDFVEAEADDPTDPGLAAQGQELSEKAQELSAQAASDPESIDADQLAECQQEATEAFTP
jgi:hypothetical protein